MLTASHCWGKCPEEVVMYEEIFPSSEVRAWLCSGVAAPLVKAFAKSLLETDFKTSTMRQRIHAAAHLAHWLEDLGIELSDLDESVLERFSEHFLTCGCARSRPGRHLHDAIGAKHFLRYLRAAGVAAPRPEASDPSSLLLERFSDWLRRHRGATEVTLKGYRPYITSVLDELGTDPSRYDVIAVRQFVLKHLERYTTSTAKAAASCLRVFIRFLVAEGLCPCELLDAVPKVAKWRLADLPRYLPGEDIEKVIAAPNVHARTALRDRAVILLLARLGLRARDIVELRLSDIDWKQGLVRVMGKGRRGTWLPLPQDAGDAVLEYLEKARPSSSHEHLFLRVQAPICPFTTGNVEGIVRRALARAGVQRPAGVSTHVFRHSLARQLLAHDVPLEGIAVVLRHRSLETTAKYAKVDVGLLQSVVQEWPVDPGVMPC
jgi:site-specific recombinase XerD